MPMNLIILDMDHEAPTPEDLDGWADELGLDFPVLADPEILTGLWYDPWAGPKFEVLIDRGMVIDTVGQVEEARVRELLGVDG